MFPNPSNSSSWLGILISDLGILENLLLLNRPAARFSGLVINRLQTMREKTEWVEEEVHWIKYRTQQQQHEKVVQLLQAQSISRMTLPLPYRDLPFPRNNSFRYRNSLLLGLEDHFRPGNPPVALCTASLVGLGGVGKTQLALEYAYRHTDHYDAIFSLKADTEANLRQSLIAYGREMQLNQVHNQQKDATLIKAFQGWLMTATMTAGG
jgi:hypothetical protein